MLKLICACFVLFTFSWSNLQGQTSAQPATNVGHSQEAVVFEQIKTKIDFENDGTGIRETTVRVRIQSEAGVQRLGVLTVSIFRTWLQRSRVRRRSTVIFGKNISQ